MNLYEDLLNPQEVSKPYIYMKIIKIIVIFVVATCIPCFSSARNIEKEYENLIKRYDVDISAKEASSCIMFWKMVFEKNERTATLFKAMIKNTRAMRSATRKLSGSSSWASSYANSLTYTPIYNDVINDIETDLGIDSDVHIYVVNETGEYNAFTFPDGKIFLENALLLKEGLTYPMLLGICAHEYAHYYLFHIINGLYKTEKRERRNKAIAGVLAGVNIAVAGYAAANGVKIEGLDETIENLFVDAELDKERFRYKYSREQEIEADIVAYRFLENIGVGGEHYIEALELLRSVTMDFVSDTSTHPSTSYRIGLLKYLRDHPNIPRNTPQYILEWKNGKPNVIRPRENKTSTSTITKSHSKQKKNSSYVSTISISGKINGYDYVDLGLSVKWATCNIGAKAPCDYGNYYAWGETLPKLSYNKDNSITYGRNMSRVASDSTQDAALFNWGGSWRMPTKDEIDELVKKCRWKWGEYNGIKGIWAIGPNGGKIFFPASGCKNGTSSDLDTHGGGFWGSTYDANNVNGAYSFLFDDTVGKYSGFWSVRSLGMSIRPVSK